MHKKILIVAAHPDDETLGCGGTIAKHLMNGDSVNVVFLSDGVTSRHNVNTKDIELRKKASKSAVKILGINETPIFFGFPDNRMDSIDLLDIVQKLEVTINSIKPEVIYTHFSGDLNVDHQITHRALMTACRPLPGSSVKEIYSFEILSSTEWSILESFTPNYFIDISQTLEQKKYAIQAYNSELKNFPHPRSTEAIDALAKYRGSNIGVFAAEGFRVERLIS
mgnify:CR=1 FL=1